MNKLTRSQRLSDAVTWFCGSWTFVIISTIITVGWVIINILQHNPFDPYPFILLNLAITIVELYQGPFIMMSQNRDLERDRETVRDLHEKLDKIMEKLQ